MARTETIEKIVFTFDELSERAKDKAREWYRDTVTSDNFCSEDVIDDFVVVCDLMGLEINQRAAKTISGQTRNEASVYWSGFWSQGDGACFEGAYSYKPGAAKAVKAYAPKNAELLNVAVRLQKAQRKHFYKLAAHSKHSGFYYHEFNMSINVEHLGHNDRNIDAAQNEIVDCFRDLARWLYRALEREYENLTSDSSVDENIRANGYEFDEFGNIN